MTIGERLGIYAEFKSLTNNDLAIKLDVHYNFVSRMINNHINISSKTLEKIMTAFPELNIRWLITGVGNMEYAEERNFVNEPGEMYGIDEFTMKVYKSLEHPVIIKKIIELIKREEAKNSSKD